MNKQLWFVSPILKERKERIKLIKEATLMSLRTNKCQYTTDYENNEKNKFMEFKKVKPSIVGSTFRPHSYEWDTETSVDRENIARLRYLNILKDNDKRRMKLEQKIIDIVDVELSKNKNENISKNKRELL